MPLIRMKGKNKKDFNLESDRNAAEEVSIERNIFWTTPEKYAEFVELLDAPPAPNQRLRKTMQTIATWDRQ